jgi:hypothetical protein
MHGRALAIVAAILVTGGAAAADSRYQELARVIDRNTGFAHMTRGVNMYTLIALRSCVSETDIPALTQMLFDRDHVLQLAASGVLVDMGAAGRQALAGARARATEAGTKILLDDALRDADAPDRKPLADYPLSERERKAIRGCPTRKL